MLLMTVLFVLFAMVAVALTVGALAVIEVLLDLSPPRPAGRTTRRVAPVAFDLDTLRRTARTEWASQSA
jgi:hypothetical protein